MKIKKYLPWIIIGIGILLRLRQYFFNRSLWLDEALLARNIIERSFVGLLQPLGYEQNAPVGFLLLSKLATVIGGPTSLALRFFPLVFGIISLFFFYRVARHFLRLPGTLIALTFFSLATPMVYYSTEFKQYMGDVLAALILWYFFLVAPPKSKSRLALLGAGILWFSHASVFILAGLGMGDISLWTYAVPIWLASFGIDYLLFLRYSLSLTMVNVWQGHFLLFPWLRGKTDVYVKSIGTVFGFFVDVDAAWVHACLLVAGYSSLARKSIKNISGFILPIVFVLIASGFEKYPFVPRLLLFFAPSLYIAIGAGADLLIACGRRIAHKAGAMIAVCVLLPLLFWGTVPYAAASFVTPIKVEELEQVMSYLHAHYQKGDIIYLYYAAESPFRFYAPKFGLDRVPVVVGVSSRDDPVKYQQDAAKLKGNPRVWVIFSHIFQQEFVGEDQYIVRFLDYIGSRLDYYPQVGASLYLYDLR